jgi:glycine cleavage system H protein
MTVLLVIVTFAVFIAVDYFVTRDRLADARLGAAPAEIEVEPAWVAGYQLPDSLHYHRGHTWARVVDQRTVVIGIDDFARRLLGPAREVTLPDRGAWLEQGERGFGLRVDGRAAELVSPLAGEVLEVNPALRTQPGLATDDPYGRGWVLKLRPAHLTSGLRNLMSGRLAHRWIEDARETLDLRLMALSGSVLQDGGEPVSDFARHLPAEEWSGLVKEFFLT